MCNCQLNIASLSEAIWGKVTILWHRCTNAGKIIQIESKMTALEGSEAAPTYLISSHRLKSLNVDCSNSIFYGISSTGIETNAFPSVDRIFKFKKCCGIFCINLIQSRKNGWRGYFGKAQVTKFSRENRSCFNNMLNLSCYLLFFLISSHLCRVSPRR